MSYGSYSEQYCEATAEETRRSSTNNSKAMTALLGTETFKLSVRPHFGHTSRSKLGPSARGKIDKDNPKELRIKLSARILFRGLSLRRGTTERTYPLSRLYRSPDKSSGSPLHCGPFSPAIFWLIAYMDNVEVLRYSKSAVRKTSLAGHLATGDLEGLHTSLQLRCSSNISFPSTAETPTGADPAPRQAASSGSLDRWVCALFVPRAKPFRKVTSKIRIWK